jgi:amino acid transporter
MKKLIKNLSNFAVLLIPVALFFLYIAIFSMFTVSIFNGIYVIALGIVIYSLFKFHCHFNKSEKVDNDPNIYDPYN